MFLVILETYIDISIKIVIFLLSSNELQNII